MGTRNLTVVIKDSHVKVAQYGQWDGYPSGQGATILRFLQQYNLQEFAKKLNIVRFLTEADEKEQDAFLEELGSKDGWLNMEQSAKFYGKYPLLSRDIGGEILEKIMASSGEVALADNYDFASDSLFCEYAYVVDLDAQVFEIYEGFVQTEAVGRFKDMPPQENGYGPVTLVKSYPLDNLPKEEDFLVDLKTND